MLCAGISQNTRLHHLTVAKGHVRGKSYIEICDNNILNIVYEPTALYPEDKIEENGELYVPPTPGYIFRDDRETLAWDSEILQSFAELTHITNITLFSYDPSSNSLDDVTWQVEIGSYQCVNLGGNHEQCVSPSRYYPFYIWTKEGAKFK